MYKSLLHHFYFYCHRERIRFLHCLRKWTYAKGREWNGKFTDRSQKRQIRESLAAHHTGRVGFEDRVNITQLSPLPEGRSQQ